MSIFDDYMWEDDDNFNKMLGVYPAKVTDNKDPEKLGRVKLRFLWRSENDETDWTRVATLFVGEGFGSYVIPDIDNEVLVSFIEGDINRPVVIGCLWNLNASPIDDAVTDNNTVKEIRTKSGHRIIFDDGENKKIEITTSKGSQIVIDDKNGSLTIKDESGKNEMIMNSDGIKLKAQNKISLEANEIEISSGTKLTLKGSAQAELSSSGTTDIKGTIINLN